MKPIKFDLKLNDGTPLRVLSDIEQNLTPELLEYFQTGKLAKWLKVRNLEEHAQKMEALLVLEKEHQAQLFKEFCEIFGEVDEDDVHDVMKGYKPSILEKNSNNEIKELKDENSLLQLKLKKYESCYHELVKINDDLSKTFNRIKSIPAITLLMNVDSIHELENKMKSKLKESKAILNKIFDLTDTKTYE